MEQHSGEGLQTPVARFIVDQRVESADAPVGERDQADESDKRGENVEHQAHALGRAACRGVESVEGIFAWQLDLLSRSLGLSGLGDHQLGHRDGGRGAYKRGYEKVASDVGVYGPQDGGVDDHNGAGDGGHASGHQAKQLAFGQPRDIGADQ